MWWRRGRIVASVALLGVALAVMVQRVGPIESAAGRLSNVNPWWVVVAVAAEAGSLICFAGLQRRLLRAGGVKLSWGSVTAISTAGNALDATLPAGLAWAGAWLFEQYGKRGVSPFLRVWFFLVAGGVSSFALFVVVAGGIELAGSSGPVSFLRWPMLVLAAIPVAFLVVEATHGSAPSRRIIASVERMGAQPHSRRPSRALHRLLTDFTRVRLRRRGWALVFCLALANWLLDALVLVAALRALDVAMDWRAVLVVYGLTQVTAALPITPGGIGVVGGSLLALLRAYGTPLRSGLVVVIFYRILTFWILAPLGWVIWTVLEARDHRSSSRSIGSLSNAPEAVERSEEVKT